MSDSSHELEIDEELNFEDLENVVAESFDVDAFLKEAGVPSSSNAIEYATKMIDMVVEREVEVSALKAELKKKSGELNFIKTTVVPQAMLDANQLATVVAKGPYAGAKVEIKDFARGSLPKQDRKPDEYVAAVSYLETLDDGRDLIRTAVTVLFDKSEHEKAKALLDVLLKRNMAATISSTVHAASLQALVRKRIREGKPIVPETLGCYAGKTVKITFPKEDF